MNEKQETRLKERRRGLTSFMARRIMLTTKRFPRISPMFEEVIGFFSGKERLENVASRVYGFFYGKDPLSRLMLRLGQGEPTAFAQTIADYYSSMVSPRDLFVYLKRRTNSGEEAFRGLMRIEKVNGEAVIESFRDDLGTGSDRFIDLAVSNNRVYLMEDDGRAYWVPRNEDNFRVRAERLGMVSGEGSLLVAPFHSGLMKAVGYDLTFGGILSPEKRAVISTAALTMHLQDHLAARIDNLTGLTTRGEFSKVLGHMVRLYLMSGTDTSIAMMDLDHFKKVNDQLGHDAGDKVLIAAANTALDTFRQEDMISRNQARNSSGSESIVRDRPVYRLGGEEIMAILAGADIIGGAVAAERYRRTLEATQILESQPERKVTVSIGVASISLAEWALRNRTVEPGILTRERDYDSLDADLKAEAIAEALPRLADKALYRAKRWRNSVVLVSIAGDGKTMENVRFDAKHTVI